jgi:hypothetical protein
MRYRRALVALIVLVGCVIHVCGQGRHANAADLNSPIVTKPTLGSEINRGTSAAFDCVVSNAINALGAGKCISEVESQNHQRMMTGYEAFSLGAFFYGWMLADRLAFAPAQNNVGQTINENWRRAAAPLFVTFRDLQRRLGVTDDQLITAGRGQANTKERIAYWSQQPRPF